MGFHRADEHSSFLISNTCTFKWDVSYDTEKLKTKIRAGKSIKLPQYCEKLWKRNPHPITPNLFYITPLFVKKRKDHRRIMNVCAPGKFFQVPHTKIPYNSTKLKSILFFTGFCRSKFCANFCKTNSICKFIIYMNNNQVNIIQIHSVRY